MMDPLGFALENYDAIGRYRGPPTTASPIDASGALPDGTKFDGPDRPARHPGRAAARISSTTVTEKLLIYALGPRRRVLRSCRRCGRSFATPAPDDYSWSSIILGITKSVPFQMSIRRAES